MRRRECRILGIGQRNRAEAPAKPDDKRIINRRNVCLAGVSELFALRNGFFRDCPASGCI